jgi:hypothetical protein
VALAASRVWQVRQRIQTLCSLVLSSGYAENVNKTESKLELKGRRIEVPESTMTAEKHLLLSIGRVLQEDTTASRRTLESALERYEKEIAIVTKDTEWSTWLERAMDAVSHAVAVWSTQVKFVNVTINGAIAEGPPGTLDGPSLNPQLCSLMVNSGIPDDIAKKTSKAIASLWEDWQSKVVIPRLAWYPSFAAFPGPLAPPTPNLPTPLIGLASSGIASVVNVEVILAKLEAELGSLAKSQGAANNLEHFSQSFSMRFPMWAAATMVQNVIGHGPVPTWIGEPGTPYSGPVANGEVIPAPGVLSGPGF